VRLQFLLAFDKCRTRISSFDFIFQLMRQRRFYQFTRKRRRFARPISKTGMETMNGNAFQVHAPQYGSHAYIRDRLAGLGLTIKNESAIIATITQHPQSCIQQLEPSVSGRDNFVGIVRAIQRLCLSLIVFINKAVDRRLQVNDGMEHAVFEQPPGQLGEETFDYCPLGECLHLPRGGVEPGA
jgi:hypothetical protein